MISDALSLLLKQVNQYLEYLDQEGNDNVAIMGNIAQLDLPDISTELSNHLVLSLVNLEEESTLKNSRTAALKFENSVSYSNPPLNINLFILWTANYRDYRTAVIRLGQVMTFFQGKNKFTPGNSPNSGISSLLDFSLTLEFMSLSLEEINHLWGSLGGKQLPFAAYRGRLITLKDQRLLDGGGLIREVNIVGRATTS